MSSKPFFHFAWWPLATLLFGLTPLLGGGCATTLPPVTHPEGTHPTSTASPRIEDNAREDGNTQHPGSLNPTGRPAAFGAATARPGESLEARLARAWYVRPRPNLRDEPAAHPDLGSGRPPSVLDRDAERSHEEPEPAAWKGLQRTRRIVQDFHLAVPFLEGEASWYGPRFHGRPTANGEIYDQDGLTAAHPNLPMDTWIEVENLANGRRARLRVNDRGPYAKGRILDLSRGAAERLGVVQKGTAPVRITVVQWPDTLESEMGFRPYTQYVVQVASYPDFERAHARRKRLSEAHPGMDFRLDRTPSGYLSVVAGPFDTHMEASRTARRLSRDTSEILVRRLRK